MIFLGIDVGLTGAIAAIDHLGHCQVHDLPTVEIAGKRMVKRRIAARDLIHLVRLLVGPQEVGTAMIEDVHMMPGGGAAARASLMQSRGIVEAVLEIAGAPVVTVEPSRWKRHFALIGKDKGGSREVAQRLYPRLAPDLRRVRDHNRAEAILIAHYAQGVLA